MHKFIAYAQLMRLDKPVGTFLLLWPTLWALWVAQQGWPGLHLMLIFCLGTWLMRSAGCVINDFADSDLDGFVTRTQNRPLVRGAVSKTEALIFSLSLVLLAGCLLLFLHPVTWIYALFALIVTAVYPLMKRVIATPQLFLGVAFSMGIPMAYAAQDGSVPLSATLLFFANFCWIVAYDTLYAIADREDDERVGIKSTAILFAGYDRLIIAILQLLFLISLVGFGAILNLGLYFNLAIAMALLLFTVQHYQIRNRNPQACFKAFLHNHWVGLVIFIGIIAAYI